jgi:uncharacterized membrane protein
MSDPYRSSEHIGAVMQRTSGTPSGGDAVEAAVAIRRPVEEVFEFYRDFQNLPHFLGDVMAIEQTGPATSRWTVQGPLGIRVKWTARLTEERTNEFISYETVPLPGLKTTWEIYFSPASEVGTTDVREVMKTPLGRLGRAGLALIGKPPTGEVPANLRRLKEVMETGTVSDTSYSVPGKFTGT